MLRPPAGSAAQAQGHQRRRLAARRGRVELDLAAGQRREGQRRRAGQVGLGLASTSGSDPPAPPSKSASTPSPLLPTTRSSKPLPELKLKAVAGSTPPEEIVLVTGSAPLKPEISVRSFDPALTVTRSGLPSKLPTKIGPGSVPTEKVWGFVVVEEPAADARAAA